MTRDVPALAHLIVQRSAQPFAWGVRDCALWAFDAVRAFTGSDPAADLRGRWQCARSAMKTLQALGGWEALCAARFGPEVPPQLVRDGDVLLLNPTVCTSEFTEPGALAIKWGQHAVSQGLSGLVCAPLGAVQRAWRPA